MLKVLLYGTLVITERGSAHRRDDAVQRASFIPCGCAFVPIA